VVRVAVAAWVSSPNAGDELVHAGLRRHLADLGVQAHLAARPRLVADCATRSVDGLVLGGGGLLQDETSAANVPFHLVPVLAARVPAVGVGLGAGPLTTRLARTLVTSAIHRLVDIAVRDIASADLLADLGIRRPIVAADLAFSLPRPRVEVEDVLVAALRPWSGRRHRLPVALRRGATAVDPAFADRAAAALDAACSRTGLRLELVALDPPKDEPLARAVADRVRAPVDVVVPEPLEVPAAVGRGRVVVAMRYHAAVGAALAGRPAVLLGYSPKLTGLAADLDARVLGWDLAEPDLLAAATADALARPPELVESRLAELQAREQGNRRVLERLLGS
jgi:polysaccharide pyruvyl transferase WcaK-like protein